MLPEGSIDPLGLAAISERLANRLVPGVRERHLHSRYLTMMAVGAVVCGGLPDDALAIDGRSEPWQVYEWYIVLGLVRAARGAKDRAATRGLPGSDKAASVLVGSADAAYLSASRYLKTPSVFGFHGVYKVLAAELGLIESTRLLDSGYGLVDLWASEQGLTGFLDGRSGAGAAFRRQFHQAVVDGLGSGKTNPRKARALSEAIFAHLAPFQAGPREADFLGRLFLLPEDNLRAVIFRNLTSDWGRDVWGASLAAGAGSERRFHGALLEERRIAPGLRSLLNAISAYESFSRLLQDAFGDCIEASKAASKPIKYSELAQRDSVIRARRTASLPSSPLPSADSVRRLMPAIGFVCCWSSIETTREGSLQTGKRPGSTS